jgi:membrane-bound lytic murein transglycosylase D
MFGLLILALVDIPHERVDYWVEQFSKGEKRVEIATYLDRKAQYEEMIRGELRRRKMPEDLLYLAMMESGFNPEAHSAQGARGIWQLSADTARLYKLRVDETVDERLDAEKSTAAALEFLRDLYGRFGSWYLAAAAYNAGANRVGRALTETLGTEWAEDDDYYRIWEKLPAETRDFVPAIIAAARIGNDPGRYGFKPASSSTSTTGVATATVP